MSTELECKNDCMACELSECPYDIDDEITLEDIKRQDAFDKEILKSRNYTLSDFEFKALRYKHNRPNNEQYVKERNRRIEQRRFERDKEGCRRRKREYYYRHKEEKIAYQKSYYEAHKAEIALKNKLKYQANKEEISRKRKEKRNAEKLSKANDVQT